MFKSVNSDVAPQEVVSGSPSQRCFGRAEPRNKQVALGAGQCGTAATQSDCRLHFCHLQSRPLEKPKCHLDIKFDNEAHHCISLTFLMPT